MHDLHCSVCAGPLGEPIFASGEGHSLTSLCRIHPAETRVHACGSCGHLQTAAIADVDGYYADEYDILVDSEEEDQVYEVRERTIYRTEHQVNTLLAKLVIGEEPLQLLDYGCAKSSTIRALCGLRPNVVPHAFDVSRRYVPFWEKFIATGNWAVDRIPPGWGSRFAVVTSFFSLEHIPAVAATMAEIAALLKPGGTFYCIVPNVFGNRADFIVVDHCNHFTAPSLRRLVEGAGLAVHEIDDHSHRGAFIVTARKEGTPARTAGPSAAEIQTTVGELAEIAEYWRGAASKVREFEATLGDRRVAIYGAGFYGAFISANLADQGRVACHLDQNPFLLGREFNGRPILAPGELPDDVDTVLVGLNPAHAASIIAGILALSGRRLNYFYL